MVPRSMCKDDDEYIQMLRDDFAAKAIQSHLITHPDTATEKIAAWSYEVADAMLRARSQS